MHPSQIWEFATIAESREWNFSAMLPLPDCPRNSPKREAHMLRTASIMNSNELTLVWGRARYYQSHFVGKKGYFENGNGKLWFWMRSSFRRFIHGPLHSGWKGVPKISILPMKFLSPKIVNFRARELIFCVGIPFWFVKIPEHFKLTPLLKIP